MIVVKVDNVGEMLLSLLLLVRVDESNCTAYCICGTVQYGTCDAMYERRLKTEVTNSRCRLVAFIFEFMYTYFCLLT